MSTDYVKPARAASLTALSVLDTVHKLFVLEYLKDFKASRAALRVGLASSQGRVLLAREDVQEAIAEEMQFRMDRVQVDADWVLQELAMMFQADLADIFSPINNTLLPIHEWPPVWRKMAASVKVKEEFVYESGMRDMIGYTKDVKIIDRLRALEMMGKHVNVQAFSERLEVTTDDDLTKRLMAGRKRAKKIIDVEVSDVSEASVVPKLIDFMKGGG